MSGELFDRTIETRKYPEDSVGRHMTLDFPVVKETLTVRETLDHLRRSIKDFVEIVYVFATDDENKLTGVVTIKKLFQAHSSVRLTEIMEKRLVKALPITSEENVVLLALQNDIKYVPIVDSEGHMVGVYTTRALRHFLNRQIERRLLRASGVRWNVLFKAGTMGVWRSVKARLPWIMVGLLGGLLSGAVIGAFHNTLEAAIILAFYIPVIMSTGANTANQSAMIFIRNVLMGNVRVAWSYFFNEVLVGLSLGLVVSIVLLFFTFLWQGSLAVAVAVSVAIFLTVVLSALMGVFIPYTLSLFRVDPSLGAGPLLTTVKDVVSMFIYFAVASVVLVLLK